MTTSIAVGHNQPTGDNQRISKDRRKRAYLIDYAAERYGLQLPTIIEQAQLARNVANMQHVFLDYAMMLTDCFFSPYEARPRHRPEPENSEHQSSKTYPSDEAVHTQYRKDLETLDAGVDTFIWKKLSRAVPATPNALAFESSSGMSLCPTIALPRTVWNT